MDYFKNKTVVVTGASSGIGKALALRLAQFGAKLGVNDINESGLLALKSELNILDDRICIQKVDTSNRTQVYDFASAVLTKFGQVDVVINNAGVTIDQISTNEIDIEDFEWLMGINFWGMVYGTKSFLPNLLSNPNGGSVVNISSIFGFVGIGYHTAYCSSKFAIRGFTESLRMELHHQESKVKAISVHPGGIQTNIAKSSKAPKGREKISTEDELKEAEKMFITTADVAAQTILSGIANGKERILIGKDAKQTSMLYRLFPVKYTDMLLKRFKKASLFSKIT